MHGRMGKGKEGGRAQPVILVLTLDSVLEMPPDKLVAALIRMSCRLQTYAMMDDQIDLAVTAMFRLVKEHEYVRAVASALSFKMPRLAQAFLNEGLESHSNSTDPYRVKLLELGRALKLFTD